MKIMTIGYGGRLPCDFVRLLSQAGVRTVVDVRLRPDRASMGAYVKAKTSDKGIEALLSKGGICYRSMVELGNVFVDDQENWRSRYKALIEKAGELLLQGIDGLEGPICLMCAERKVCDCHRLQIAEFLKCQGKMIEHLDGE